MKNTKTIEELAYILTKAKENSQPKPIFFLGAGASKTGNIPLAKDIIEDILKKHAEAPAIKRLDDSEKDYFKLMGCLQPYDRDELLKGYIDNAKINVTHIYLAQLLFNGYVDYVLTVNFDNLMLRALSLFNVFPSTYDMAILKDLTTTTFKEKSIVYLHGQHHGVWLLNTAEEMEKVSTTVPRIFDSIKNKRPWVFIGYSANDPIFEHIRNLGRFDNGLFWVTHNNEEPNKKVNDFLNSDNTNASIIEGYDSDSFMLKLNTELGLDQPKIINTPFTSIGEMLDNIIDIDDEEHFKGIKERLEISKEQVNQAIKQFEEGEIPKNQDLAKKSKENQLKKEIINFLIDKEYDESRISEIEAEARKINNNELDLLLADLYNKWGVDLSELAESKKGKEKEYCYHQAIEKYQKVTDLKPDYYQAFYNWGTALVGLGEAQEGEEKEYYYHQAIEKYQKVTDLKPDDHQPFYNMGVVLGKLAEAQEGKEKEHYYHQAIEKYQKASDLNPDDHEAFYNWGAILGKLAESKEGKEKEHYYHQAFEKYQKATDLKPDDHQAFYNWGVDLGELAEAQEGEGKEHYYQQAIEKYQKVTDLKPDDHHTFNNWGTALVGLGDSKDGDRKEHYYQQAIEKFEKATDLKPDDHQAFNNWGTALVRLGGSKEGEKKEGYYRQAFEKYQKAIDCGGISYNLSCLYALQGATKNALKYLEISLSKGEIGADFVKNDTDWRNYSENEDFILLLEKYK